MKRSNIIIFTILFIFIGCEQETIIFPDIKYAERKIAVSAFLDTDGEFQVAVSKVSKLTEYKPANEIFIPEIRTGKVLLYEDGIKLLDIEQQFDLINVNNQKPLFLYRKGVSSKAGSVYRLEVAIEGYDPIISTAIMPCAPVVKSIIFDAATEVTMYHVLRTGYWGVNNITDGVVYNKLYLSLDDSDESGGFYSLQAFEVHYYEDNIINNDSIIVPIGSNDWNILSGNPEIEVRGSLWDTDVYELYSSSPFLFDNRSFVNTTVDATFYVVCTNYFDNAKPKMNARAQKYILLKRITKETMQYYRSVLLQSEGLNFFNSEPTTIPSNIQNGYGCFSLSNTVKFMVLEYEF